MTAAQFTEWMTAMQLSKSHAARLLGVHRNTIRNYEKGLTPVPAATATACQLLLRGRRP